jgi:hypothetical protein
MGAKTTSLEILVYFPDLFGNCHVGLKTDNNNPSEDWKLPVKIAEEI